MLGLIVGFNVDTKNRVVSVDHSHHNYCDTSTNGNPVTEQLADGLLVTSIFKRTKGRRDRDIPGDNSPMLYALKGLHDLKTNFTAIKALERNYKHILNSFIQTGFLWDCLMPLPSSSNLTKLFAKSVCKQTRTGMCYNSALKKITAAAVLESIPQLTQISSPDRTKLRSSVRKFIRYHSDDTEFQMKSITPVNLRKHINPIMWGGLPFGASPPNNILLVDDMITSGTSLLSASTVIRQHYPFANIQALTLFGSSNH